MKVLFLLGNPGIGGGTYVIYQHALKCQEMGMDVTIVTDEKVNSKILSWHEGASKLKFKKYKEIKDVFFDVAIATWYRTVYYLPKIKAKSYIYFVQSIESRFYLERDIKWLVDSTYTLPISYITEATWIQKYLKENFGINAILVKNGIRKDIYNVNGPRYPKKKDCFRLLIEGPIDVFFKNVPKTVALAKKSKATEIWLLTSSDIKKYPNVDRVFSKQTISECAKIYRSCDCLVKLSYVEGMFGPPLEMFHCGGTAITYNVSGYDEYLKHNYNSLIAKIGNDEEEKLVIQFINSLVDNPKLLAKLKRNALKTADAWPNWNQSSQEFYEAVLELSKNEYDYVKLNKQIEFMENTYVYIHDLDVNIKQKILNYLKRKFPKLYKYYRKIRYKI